MTDAGQAAFARRDRSAALRYRHANRPADLPPAALAALRRDRAAWAFWQAQPPGDRRAATWWVVSAKREATRARRLAELSRRCARGERLPALAPSRTR